MPIKEATEVDRDLCPEWCVVPGEHDTHISAAMRRFAEHRVEVVLEQDGTASVTVEGTAGFPAFLDPENVATLIEDVARASAIAWPERLLRDN
jgi:hypothetical protein